MDHLRLDLRGKERAPAVSGDLAPHIGARDLAHPGGYPQIEPAWERHTAAAGSFVLMLKRLHIPTARRYLSTLAAAVIIVVLALAGCSSGSGPTVQGQALEEQEADLTEAFEERDRFFSDQQAPPGKPLAGPVTAPQREFIDSQREHIVNNGGEWNEMTEQITLALTFDACESAILNLHQIDTSTLGIHIATSPLFEMLTQEHPEEQRKHIEASLLSTALYGMSYICPTDYDQWFDAAAQLYPERFNG